MIKCKYYITEETLNKKNLKLAAKLNINDIVRVKLTEYGMKVLDKKYNENQKRHICRIDKEGYFTTQLWTLFSIFGEGFEMHSPQVFEMNEILVV